MNQDSILRRRDLNPSDKERLPVQVLLHCRTVVEKANFVTTGVMTQVEGELFEIEVQGFELFELGEAVKLTVYSPAGIQSFQSIVFAKYNGAIAVIQPPNLHEKFLEKREHFRIETSGEAQITSIMDASEKAPRLLAAPLTVSIKDISLGGIGFASPELLPFSVNQRVEAVIDLGFTFSCHLEILRREKVEDIWFFGARMQLQDREKLRPLRAFILRKQVDMLTKLRAESDSKRKSLK